MLLVKCFFALYYDYSLEKFKHDFRKEIIYYTPVAHNSFITDGALNRKRKRYTVRPKHHLLQLGSCIEKISHDVWNEDIEILSNTSLSVGIFRFLLLVLQGINLSGKYYPSLLNILCVTYCLTSITMLNLQKEICVT